MLKNVSRTHLVGGVFSEPRIGLAVYNPVADLTCKFAKSREAHRVLLLMVGCAVYVAARRQSADDYLFSMDKRPNSMGMTANDSESM